MCNSIFVFDKCIVCIWFIQLYYRLNVFVCTAPKYITRHIVYRERDVISSSSSFKLRAQRESKYKLDSPCVSFDLHPSSNHQSDYLIALSSQGNIFVYHIITNELRGIIPTNTIDINQDIMIGGCCKVDPSGMVVVVAIYIYIIKINYL